MSTSTSSFTEEELKKAEQDCIEATIQYVRDNQKASVFTQKGDDE